MALLSGSTRFVAIIRIRERRRERFAKHPIAHETDRWRARYLADSQISG
jgi:hypothetical protein